MHRAPGPRLSFLRQFAIVQNGNPISTTWARRAQDRFALALARS